MKRVIAEGLLLALATGSAVVAQPYAGQTDSAPKPISNGSDWDKLMPNGMLAPAPTISLPASKFTKPPVAPQTVGERVSKNVQEALTYAKTDDWEKSLESIDKAVALDPSVDFLYSFRSKVFGKLGRNNEAVKDMIKYKELQAKSNLNAVNTYHQQQVQQVGQPDLRTRVRNFLGQ